MDADVNATISSSIPSPIIPPSYRRLPAFMYKVSTPDAAVAPSLIALNTRLLTQLGQDAAWFQSQAGLLQLSGKVADNISPPIALAYSGHQYGGWSAQLGDGRAHLLGQLLTDTKQRIDVQLKGSGATYFSRGGDGRATLGAVLREYLVSEAMAGLGIATTGSLAVIATGERVRRETLRPGAILVRTAKSHIRVGSFQFAAAHHGKDAVKALADFTLSEHYPELLQHGSPYAALLGDVIARQAKLVAQWMLVGFIHGVLNTDNCSITAETIDYGPCAFMDEFHPQKVFSSIDSQGRYAWGNQGAITQWNMARFAEALLPLLADDEDEAITLAEAQLARFHGIFSEHFYQGMARKLALQLTSEEATAFADDTMQLLARSGLDFTVFFDALTALHAEKTAQTEAAEKDFDENDALISFSQKVAIDRDSEGYQALQTWLSSWLQLARFDDATQGQMRLANPRVIARNHRVEDAIAAAELNNDFEPFFNLARVLVNPYQLDAKDSHYQTPPAVSERVTQTFCGT